MPFSLAHLCMLLCLLECFPNSIPVGQSGTLKLNLSLGYINIGMEDNSIKKIIKDTQFFETTSYKRFEKDIQEMNFKVKPEKINQISLKCSGYGYFEQGRDHHQGEMKKNFLQYLRDSINLCPSLKILKIDYNGFSNDNKQLNQIIETVGELLQRKGNRPHAEKGKDKGPPRFDAIWFHTRHLRDCSCEEVERVLDLTTAVAKSSVEEISIRMAGWDFKKEIDYSQLLPIFEKFASQMSIVPTSCWLKTLRLDFSSWYTKNLNAYNFLIGSVEMDQLVESFKKNNEELEPYQKDLLQKYIRAVDQKYRVQNRIPGAKPIILSRDGQYKKRIFEYVQQQIHRYPNMNQNDREQLLKIIDDKWGLTDQHSKQIKKIKEKVDQEIKEQQTEEKKDAGVVAEAGRLEQEVSKMFFKFPFDHVMALRVKQFHIKFIQFMQGLHSQFEGLNQIDVEMDFRNWNSIFKMNELKKILDKELAQEGMMKLLSNAFSRVIPRGDPKDKKEEGPEKKKKYTFLM